MSTSQTVPRTIDLAAHAIEVTKTYGAGPTAVTALDRVSVAIGRRRFSAVMGRPARASPPCCTAWRASTASTTARSSSAAST
jgi:hypothetical protein